MLHLLGCDESVTHQDGQHNILEVVPQVGGVSAEEDEVALYQLQKSEIKHSDSRPRLVCSALRPCCAECQMKRPEKLLTVFRSDFIPTPASHGWQLTPPLRWEGRKIYRGRSDAGKKSWKVCNNSNGLNPRCQSWGTGLHVTRLCWAGLPL